ncbi:MAG: RICIN domain-containing protein, partial [Ferruginibacter sp.]
MKFKIAVLLIGFSFCLTLSLTAQLVNGAVYKIKNVASGRYAQTGYASPENGATIHLYDNQDAGHFNWKA